MATSKSDKPADSNRGLRMVVISMGLVLIGGTILLFFMAFKKMNEKVTFGGEHYVPREYRECGHHEIALAPGESLIEVQFEGVIARVTVELANGGTAIRLVQSCSGEQLGGITIQPSGGE